MATHEARDSGDKLPSNAPAPGNAEVQSATEKATKVGYEGTRVDETPDEEYTVKGVLKHNK